MPARLWWYGRWWQGKKRDLIPDSKASCISQGHCIQARGGSGPSDAAVRPVMIVVLEEGRQQGQALLIRGVGPGVGPFSLEDLDEGLRLAVGLGTIGSGALEADVPLRGHLVEGSGDVAPAVVGEDALGRGPREAKWVGVRSRKAAVAAPCSLGRAST
jgi:hypothetical protein